MTCFIHTYTIYKTYFDSIILHDADFEIYGEIDDDAGIVKFILL